MRIQNLKNPPSAVMEQDSPPLSNHPPGHPTPDDPTSLEVAFLKARIQHLELVLETARSLMGSNHERLLRRLHEVPKELVDLGNRLRRFDIQATW